ncbi:Rft protein-domain-containing protein [Aspergillus avenaceus]|uniref:Man(5)GlcNAc(2)-PP-dolichol translocation protein RFT1 n=1 Tax=Aspergillus avenaceus TaxID=36643 RepID=A0A5N6TIR6_ASPAV|nr:Rft protein-domain-containing protein [Aspergillus avenaceus]
MSQSDDDVGKILASSTAGTTSLIIVQLASRLFTFISNQLILRSLSPAILGIAAQLELFNISILYFSRESIRTAIQRQPLDTTPVINASYGDKAQRPCEDTEYPVKSQSIPSQSVVNMSYLSIGVGIPTAFTSAILYVHFASAEVSQAPFYHVSVLITTIASLIELSVEPFFVVVQQYMMHKRRAAVEMAATFFKSLTVCTFFASASWMGYNLGVLPFALGYLSYSLLLFGGYFQSVRKPSSPWRFSLFLTKIKTSDNEKYVAGMFPRKLIALSANVYFQSIVKHLLTQGDTMMLAAMTSLEDQGMYSLASNYGGLIARVLFQPIEENGRMVFSSLLNSGKPGQRFTNSVSAAKAHLIDILRGYGVLSALMFPLAPYLVPRMLHLMAGRRWASPQVGGLLSLYCYYIPFLAFNGITEAFVSSTASASDLRKQAGWMGVFSACFASVAYLFLQIGGWGAHGLILANIVNMAVRTIWSLGFIRSYFHQHGNGMPLAEFSIQPQTWIAGAVASIVLTIRRHDDFGYRSYIEGFVLSATYALLV